MQEIQDRPKTLRKVLAATCLSIGALLAQPRHAAAIQPLEAFLAAAEGHNWDVRAAAATQQQRVYEAHAQTGKLLPSLGLAGGYTRNQYAVKFPIGDRLLSLSPHNQFDATATLTVPILDVANWARSSAAWSQASMARAQYRVANVSVAKAVAQRYYALRGQEGVLDSARRSLDLSKHTRTRVQERFAVGAASSLDQAQAQSDEALAEQNVAAAELQVLLARRALATLSGLEAQEAGTLPEASLHEEAPLEHWLQRSDGTLPKVAVARAAEQAAAAGKRAARFGYMPTVNLTGSERISNATALNGGHMGIWTVKANLAWQLDAQLTPLQHAQRYAAEAAQASLAQASRDAEDVIYADYAQIVANCAKSRAARAQVAATQLAATLADEKMEAGVITQLDVTQARRDAFSAEVNRIQADADLLYYRTLLRLDAGIAAFAEEK